MLIGGDPLNINKIWQRMFKSLHNGNVAGGFGGDAISSIDIALWDIAGKASGKSISELLGGSVREKVAVYATGLYYKENEFPHKLIKEAESYAKAGFKGMKTKIGALNVKDDVKRVKAIRDAIGDDFYLMVDANKVYAAPTAIEIGNRLAELDIHWFEEPVLANDVESYLEVKKGQPIPVAGGEVLRNRFEVRDIVSRKALDILQPDVSLAGGISEMKNIATIANAFGIQVNPHLWGSPIMVSATLSVASTLPPCPYVLTERPYEQEPVVEFDQTENPIRTELGSFVFEQEDGYVDVPGGPGLGVEVNRSTLEKYCVHHVSVE